MNHQKLLLGAALSVPPVFTLLQQFSVTAVKNEMKI